ncbi:MAG: DUF2993 domain-containing protein [Halanaerobiaceae bacterium]
MTKKWGKIIYWLVIIFLLVFIVLQLALPPYISRDVEKHITDNSQEVNNLEVETRAFPAWKYFYSRADRGSIKADLIKVDGLELREVDSHYRDLYLGSDYISGENTDLHILITEESLNQYIQGHYPELERVQITLQPEQILITGYVTILETEVQIRLSGSFEVRDPDVVVFKPEDIKVEKLLIPQQIIEDFFSEQEFGFAFSLEELNFPLQIEEIVISENEVRLLGGKFVEGND